MTGTRTIPVTVPATWYVGEHASDAFDWRIWEYRPDAPDRPRPILGGDGPDADTIRAALMAAMPRMRWAVLAPDGDEIQSVASEAQAWVYARVWSTDEPDPAVVLHRIGDTGDWTDSSGLTYADPDGDGDVLDLMADPASAFAHLLVAQGWARRDSDAAAHHQALRREAAAHGHDLTPLER